jgi:HSP20 family protein
MFGRPAYLRMEGNGKDMPTTTDWAPAVDIAESPAEYLIKAELPEMRKEDVKVKVDRGIIRIEGERRLEKDEKNRKYHRVERAYGSFTRAFNVPEDVEASKVSAQFKDGVLNVHLPKSEKKMVKEFEVPVG